MNSNAGVRTLSKVEQIDVVLQCIRRDCELTSNSLQDAFNRRHSEPFRKIPRVYVVTFEPFIDAIFSSVKTCKIRRILR